MEFTNQYKNNIAVLANMQLF